MKILFINLSGMVFTAATPDNEPLGGTESAMCYLARALAKRGHAVTMACRQPENAPPQAMGVRHVPPQRLLTPDFLNAENFDVIIPSNAPMAGPPLRAMAPHALILLWNHLAPDHTMIETLKHAEARDGFDAFVYVSNWQRGVTESTFGFKKPCAVIGNGFAPAFANLFSSAEELAAAKQNRAAYFTTPFRGLSILIDAFMPMETGTALDVYSSMKVYQSQQRDDQFAPLYAYAATSPHVHLHGAVAQTVLAEKLKPAAFFTYPSIYPETFCIAALEARAAGMKVLTTGSAALPEVLGDNAAYIRINPGNHQEMARHFRSLMRHEIDLFKADRAAWAAERFADLRRVNRECSWEARALEWEHALTARTFAAA